MAVSLRAESAPPRVPPFKVFVLDTAFFFPLIVTQMTFCFLVFDVFERVFSLFWEVEQRPSHITLNRCCHFAVKAFWWTRDVCCLHLPDAYVEDISVRVSLNLVRSGHLPAANRRGTCEEGSWLA
jgi:hypothetical protein